VIARANGLPSVDAVRGAYGLTAPHTPLAKITLRPSGWASVLFAVSHSCEPPPVHSYDRLVITIRGRTFAVGLPERTRMAVSPSCPPAVSPFLSGVHLSGGR
jgi:hypothetical protein